MSQIDGNGEASYDGPSYGFIRKNIYEDHFIHKLAALLRLEHRDLIAAKLKIKDERLRSASSKQKET